MPENQNLFELALARTRTRSSWNDRLIHWERPASEHEEAKIQRASDVAKAVVAANDWLTNEGTNICPQGSYYNNTNVRLEADIDLRVQLPGIKVEYMDGILPSPVFGYSDRGMTFFDGSTRARSELENDLIRHFGSENVDTSGNKAIRVKGLDGSRADCDLVPAFHLHVIRRDFYGNFYTVKGVAIMGKDGSWTYNFPEQHYENGKAKRLRTEHRFKKCVRMLKRLNYELEELGIISERMPSFLIECLVYAVEDEFFLFEEDDRFDRLLRILIRLSYLFSLQDWINSVTEINEIKLLFSEAQSWDINSARAFVQAAINRLLS